MKPVIVIFLVFLCSCKQSAVQGALSEADSLVVHFFNDDGMIYKAITSTERSAISKLTTFLDNKMVEPGNCVMSGKIVFFSQHKMLLDADYTSRVGCRYLRYILEGKQVHAAMSNEANDFLQALKEDPRY